jgi:gas vesicle protein
MLNNVIKLGGTIMIVKELVDRIRYARSDRDKAIRRNKAGMLALGVSIGCTVGAVAGVLFAPRAGKETREEVGRLSGEAWEKIKDNVSTNGHRLVNTLEEQGARVHKVAEKGVDAVKEVLAETSDKAEKGVDAAKEVLAETTGKAEKAESKSTAARKE